MSVDLTLALRQIRIVPVIVIERIEHAVPLARALVDCGLSMLEITLRTDAALQAIAAIRAEVPAARVGAGTVLNAAQCRAAVAAGAAFVVSPGLTEEVVNASREFEIPLLPGVATPSDIMKGLSHGLNLFKFFPAESLGGVNYLKALYAPFPQVQFCPTGGISPQNLHSYLALPNVAAAGGSWMVPDLAEAGALERVRSLAREALRLA
jgi:2-dehydro-3-deoxyphosphogluconate aldolase/(4S)-4-hydroxy-2-oxoglutarate aldolase